MSNSSENKALQLAWELVEHTGANLFLTGKAGTGKTTFLRNLRDKTTKRTVVLAPTGIAAINAQGQTIHSFFQLSLSPFVPGSSQQQKRYDRFNKEKLRIIRSLDLLVIDEISMVRADLLDAVDNVLRRHCNPWQPFGGVQLLMIGDLAQLAPVVTEADHALLGSYYETPYFFSSKALQQAGYEMLELDHVYRQNDASFVAILNNVRNGMLPPQSIQALNARYIPDFTPADSEGYVRLVTHNNQARAVNEQRLQALPGSPVVFKAKVQGNFPDTSFPVDAELELKKNARVMFVKNDPSGRFVNGTLGRISHLDSNTVQVIPDGESEPIDVQTMSWENTKYTLDEQTQAITETIEGQFIQLPLRAAWAITIHKSQGLTFDRAIIDAHAAFAHGQTYVALSRCRTLDGLVLETPITPSVLNIDGRVAQFTRNVSLSVTTPEKANLLKAQYHLTMLDRLFSFEPLRLKYNTMHRLVDEFLASPFPQLAKIYNIGEGNLRSQLEEVSQKFRLWYMPLVTSGNIQDNPSLAERIKKACGYFRDNLRKFVLLLQQTPTESDNKAASERIAICHADLSDWLFVRMRLLEHFAENDFSVQRCLEVSSKAALELDGEAPNSNKKATKKKEKKQPKQESVSADVNEPELYLALTLWRRTHAASLGIPAYSIISTKALVNIANDKPQTMAELQKIKGVGQVISVRYGQKILEVIATHLEPVRQ